MSEWTPSLVPPPGPEADPGEVRPEDRSDDDLMLLVRGGHAAAFDVLVRRYQRRVLRVACRRLGRLALARDVGQETFLNVFRSAHQYQPRGTFCSYLFRVLLHECVVAERKAGAERRRIGRLEEAMLCADGAAPSGGNAPIDELILAREREQDLHRAVSRLRPKLRDAITLVYLGELTYQQAADTLGVPMGTLKRRIFDALLMLRDLTKEP